MSFDLADYTTVAERLENAFERYPDCRFQSELDEVRNSSDELTGWKCRVAFFRTPEDTVPIIAHAVEPYPGKTSFTKDSEAMNAETSAIGRALILAGFPSKKIASADEVRARAGDAPAAPREEPQDNGIPENVILPWGKHKGANLGAVPRNYLEWLVTKFEAKNAEQRRIVAAAQAILTGPSLSEADDGIPF